MTFSLSYLAIAPGVRMVLLQRIAIRFEQMLDQGFLDDVLAIRTTGNLHCALTSIRALGYRQVRDNMDA
ncbi:tRNA (adenosine(37)-N6)-dimethylallyltransferase MiaA, partial [Pseudomonas syringae pv. tagetis]